MPYTRHNTVMSSEYDSSFRALVTAGWTDKTQGAVDEPIGHLTMMTLSRWEQGWRDYLNEEGLPVPSAGLYIVHENEIGMVVVFSYDDEGDREADWANAEAENIGLMEEGGA